MLSIFIPQDTLEDIVIDNMSADIEPEDQDVWFKIFTNQEYIYVSSWNEKKYLTQEDDLFELSKSYGVKIRYASQYIEDIPDNHGLVTEYWNGIFLLDITEEEAAEIQRDYGVICQSVNHRDASVLMDPGLRFSPGKNDRHYSWDTILREINGEQIPSNHLIIVDRYLLARDKHKKRVEELKIIHSNLYDIMNAHLPIHELKCHYKITIIISEQKEGEAFSTLEISKTLCEELIPSLNRPYDIDLEMVYLTHLSGLHSATHNRCILTNYTVTQLEHSLKAFDEDQSICLQTIMPQGLFTSSGLNNYCDSPHKTHHEVMSAIYDYLIWWVKNYLTPKSTYIFNKQEMKINKKYRINIIDKIEYLLDLK